jgi:hypothetical protein
VADLHRRARPIQGLTAAARILQATREDAPKPEHWHEEAWAFRNDTGELRFAELWLGNSLSRVRLVAAKRPEPGAEPEPLDDGPAAELMADLAGGPGGQAALNRAFAAQLMTPGVGYLLGEPGPSGANRWGVYSADQLRLSQQSTDDGQRTYELREGEDSARDWRLLPEDALPVKVWRPHPRWSWVPDSPVRGALPILRELTLLTQHVEASATSRLAGAGVLAIDSSVQFEQGWEAWVEEFLATVTKPIKQRDSAAAYAPFPVRIPGPNIKEKLLHLMFNTPFDEHSLKLRDEAISRLATAMDMPKAALTGEQENHWGKWATTEEGITLHVEPNMELVCDGLTKGYLWPGLRAGTARRQGVVVTSQDDRRLRLADPTPESSDPDADIIVWYDTTDLRVRPDRSSDTLEAWDRWAVDDNALRRQLGITEEQAPTGQAFERRVWLKMIDSGDPQLQRLALIRLGVVDEAELPAAPAPMPPQLPGPAPALPPAEPADEQGLPDTDEAPPPSQDAPRRAPQPAAATLHPGLPLVAACDGIVHRALEKCGNRLRNYTARERIANPTQFDQPPHLMHTACNAARIRPLEVLLADAWDRVPELAGNLGFDSDHLAAQLDAYTRQLIRTRQPHSWQALSDYLVADVAEAV